MDGAGNVINLSTKAFDRDTFKLLNKNFILCTNTKVFQQNEFFNKINGFYQRIKLKTHFKDQKNKPKTEKVIFTKPTDKTWIPPNNYHTIEALLKIKKLLKK